MSMESMASVSAAHESQTEDNVPKKDVIGTSTRDAQDEAEDCAAQTAKPLQTEHDVKISGYCESKWPATLLLRRVSSLTDLRKFTEQRNSSQKVSKSEGNISISEFATSHDFLKSVAPEPLAKDLIGHQGLVLDKNEAMQAVEKADKISILTSISEKRPEVNEDGKKMAEGDTDEQENQCISSYVTSGIPQEYRKRSLSDSTSLKSPSIFTAEQLRKTKSYTTFPHIDTHSQHTSPSIHRTFSFRLLPHLSEDSFPDLDYPTISVMSRSSQFDNNPFNVASEVSSESEDSDKEQGNVEESIFHSWRRPSGRPRSISEPVSVVETATGARTWSLPDIKEKSSRIFETINKVTASPSRLRFPEQFLENLKEESESSCQEQSTQPINIRSSSVTSVADGWEEDSSTNLFSSQEVPGGDEVTGHWINRQRRQSITCSSSFPSVKEVDEEKNEELEAGNLNQTPSAVSLVNQVTEQVLSSHDVDVLTESDDEEQSHTVDAAVRLWKNKQSGRRATLATVSPLSDFPKYASEIEQQAFQKIKKWKDNFALKLNNVLGERFQEMAAKHEEEMNRKKKPKVLKVPMNLSDKEMGQLRNNLLLELKRKSIGDADSAGLTSDSLLCPPPPPPPIPRIKFPRRTSTDQSPADLRAQMMKELNRRVSCIPDDGEALHCYKPSSLVPDLSKTSLQVKPQNVVYIPRGLNAKTLDFESIRDLLSWHEAERKRLKAELERLPQAEQAGEQQLLIDKDDANRVLQSMMKIMEDIFTGTMKRFIGSAQPATQVEESKEVTETLNDDIKEANFQIVETESKEHEAKVDNQVKVSNEVSILPASDSTKSLSSGISSELLSSESTLTGISFTSSSGTCESIDDTLAMLGSDTLVTLQNDSRVKSTDSVNSSPHLLVSDGQYNEQIARAKSTSAEATHGKFPNYSKPTEETPLHSKPISECCTLKSPWEFTKRTVCHETCENDKQIQVQQLQRALQDKSESEDILKRRFESLKNKVSRTENKSDYWFNECVKKEEKIKELLIREQDVNSLNTELRQQISSKSKIIKEQDTEIQKITKSKNETKAILQEVNMKLFKANEEVERLKMIVRQSLKEDHILNDKKINKKTGISDWVSEVIMSAKAELVREKSLYNSSTDPQFPEHSVNEICDNQTAKHSLSDIISSFKKRISNNVKAKRSEGYLSGFNKRPLALSSSDGKGNRQQALDTDDSSVIFDSSAPYPDVFLTMFEYMDFSPVNNLVALEPFGDTSFPWVYSKDARIKQLKRGSDPTALATEFCLNTEEHIERNLETVPGEQKVRLDIPTIFLERSKETAAERKEKPSFGNAHLCLTGIRAANQCISVPLTETHLSNRTPRDHLDGLVAKINNVTSFSEQFTTVENDIEHTIPEVYAKKPSSVLSPRDQRCMVEKGWNFKMNNSKFIPTTRNKRKLPNGHGFIDPINVEIKLNTEQRQLREELENRKLCKTQRPKESLNTQESLTKLTLEAMNPQRKKRLPSEFNEDRSVCSLSSGFDQKISTHISFTGGNGRNITEMKKYAEDKQIITNTKCKAKSNRPKSQPFAKGNLYSRQDNPETKRLSRNISSGHKGQQEKSERDVRIKMWREKNGWIGNKSKDKTNDSKNMEHGLVWKTRDTKFSGGLKSSKMGTKTEERLTQDQIIQSRKTSSFSPAGVAVKNVISDPYRTRFDSNSTTKGKDVDYLMALYKSTADVLKRQEKQKMAIQKCMDRVHFMTEELETLQRRTDEERSIKKGAKMTSSQLVSSWL